MSRDLYIEILKPIPKRFLQDRIYEDSELELLSQTDWNNPEDRYHKKIRIRSVYAGINDIKEYLQPKMPDVNFQSWACRSFYGGILCYGEGWEYRISKEEYESLKRPHEYESMVEYRYNEWSIQDYDAKWLAEICPLYLTKQTLKRLLIRYLDHLKQMDPEELINMDSDTWSGSIFRRCCEAAAYAEQTRSIAIVKWE